MRTHIVRQHSKMEPKVGKKDADSMLKLRHRAAQLGERMVILNVPPLEELSLGKTNIYGTIFAVVII